MKMWVWVVVIVLVFGGGYLYRGQIMSMFSGGYSSPVSYAPTNSAPTAIAGDVINWVNGTTGQYATGANGMTLYTFDKDTKGVSNCTGSCAGVWPPYTSATTPSTMPTNLTLIERGDGTMQFAYKGMPVYYYSGDTKVGDVTGNGFNGIWHLVKP